MNNSSVIIFLYFCTIINNLAQLIINFMFNLNLNIDHFATLRNARGGNEPDVVFAALQAEMAGATGIVAHLRKDRRHINEKDVNLLKNMLNTKLNLEMCTDDEIMKIALDVKPTVSTLVPERPNEVTTEGGLDVVKHLPHIKECTQKLHDAGILVSLFIEADIAQIDAAIEVKADGVEFNTGKYALAKTQDEIDLQISSIWEATNYAIKNELVPAAGHSINYHNIKDLCDIVDIKEYNIGHAIVSRSLFIGVSSAIKEMLDKILKYKTFNMSAYCDY